MHEGGKDPWFVAAESSVSERLRQAGHADHTAWDAAFADVVANAQDKATTSLLAEASRESDLPVHPLCDEDTDTKNAEWVARHRGRQQGGQWSDALPPRPRSDATLACPFCFAQLSKDCQRHARYHDQYRAVIVFNCRVDESQLLRHTDTATGKPSMAPEDAFLAVHCGRCDTQVGCQDHELVYHFFNVIASPVV